jgi:hypothetical protein
VRTGEWRHETGRHRAQAEHRPHERLSGIGNGVGGPARRPPGAAWVYTRSGGIWTQQGKRLAANDAVGPAFLGNSVALSGDGNIAIVGGFFDNAARGAAWVYIRSGGVWSQQNSKLVGTSAAGTAEQGWSVALSADGNTAIVGGFDDNSGSGAVWVFVQLTKEDCKKADG